MSRRVQPALRRTDGNTQRRGNLAVRVADHVVEDAETLVVERQRLQSRADHDRVPRIRPGNQVRMAHVRLDVDDATASAFPVVVDTPVDDDSMKPCRGGRFVAERVAMMQRLNEGVMHDVFRVLTTDICRRDGAEPSMRALIGVGQGGPHRGS